MAQLVFTIEGVDIRHLIVEDGIKWQRSDLDGENAGRNKAGDVIRDRIAIKRRCDITCRDMTIEEAQMLQRLIEPEFISVQFTDLLDGIVTKVMYSNNGEATIGAAYDDGDSLVTGISFPLIEK